MGAKLDETQPTSKGPLHKAAPVESDNTRAAPAAVSVTGAPPQGELAP